MVVEIYVSMAQHSAKFILFVKTRPDANWALNNFPVRWLICVLTYGILSQTCDVLVQAEQHANLDEVDQSPEQGNNTKSI